jgi:hypothetical protein
MRVIVALVLVVGCTPAAPSVSTANDAPTTSASSSASAPPPAHRIGQPYFIDAGVQAMDCEEGSPPLLLDRTSSTTSCWFAGTSCAGRGAQIGMPFTLEGNIVAGSTIHGGCDLGSFALVYERGTSPLRLRVCEKRPPPMDCPAMVHDGARWDITALLEANHATTAQLLKEP